MPKSSRTPINYRSQFSDAMFRPREVVEAELAGEEAVEAAPPALAARPSNRTERSPDRSNERTNERLQVRHSFDIWQDQLTALAGIQTERFAATGRKPKIGTLVQEALDAYIVGIRKRTNERSNERSSP